MTTEMPGFLWDVAQDGYTWLTARPADPRGGSEPEPFLVETRLLKAGPARFRRYDPSSQATSALFRMFADTWRSQAGIRQFANVYGPLGVGIPVPDSAGTPAAAGTVMGEPLSVWGREITAMRRSLDVWDGYRRGHADGLAQCILWQQDAEGGDRVLFEGVPMPDERGQAHPDEEGFDPDGDELFDTERFEIRDEIASPRSHADWLARFKRGDVFLPALAYVQRQVNEHLRASGPPALLYDLGQDRLVLRQVPQTLLGAMWLQFAAAIDGNKKYHQCRGCRKWFEVTPRGMRSTRFHCTNGCRIRAHRERRQRALRLHAEGASFPEIARELEADLATVKRWIAGGKA
jgi:hypothetical protein